MTTQGILMRVHCDDHVDAQGDRVPCPGHYLRLGAPHRIRLASGGVATVTPWEEETR